LFLFSSPGAHLFCLPVTLFFCGSKIFVAIRRGVFFQGEFVCYEIDTGRKSHFFPLSGTSFLQELQRGIGALQGIFWWQPWWDITNWWQLVLDIKFRTKFLELCP